MPQWGYWLRHFIGKPGLWRGIDFHFLGVMLMYSEPEHDFWNIANPRRPNKSHSVHFAVYIRSVYNTTRDVQNTNVLRTTVWQVMKSDRDCNDLSSKLSCEIRFVQQWTFKVGYCALHNAAGFSWLGFRRLANELFRLRIISSSPCS